MAIDTTNAYLTQIVKVAFRVSENGPELTTTLVGRARNADDLLIEYRNAHPEITSSRIVGGQGIYDGDWLAINP